MAQEEWRGDGPLAKNRLALRAATLVGDSPWGVSFLFLLSLLFSVTQARAEPGFSEQYERDDNIFNPASRYAPVNPLNPANRDNPTTSFAPLNRGKKSWGCCLTLHLRTRTRAARDPDARRARRAKRGINSTLHPHPLNPLLPSQG